MALMKLSHHRTKQQGGSLYTRRIYEKHHHLTRGDTETDMSPQPSTEDLWPKIFHTTGKLPTVTTVMQPQQHKDPP